MSEAPILGVVLADFGLSSLVVETLRVVAAVAGALVAWFVVGPLARALARLAFQRSLPQGGQIAVRIGGGVLAGVLIYLFLPLGLGGGPGGGGLGTGNGKGDGKDSGSAARDKATDKTTDKAATDKNGKNAAKDWLFIEVLGGDRYPGEHKFYLLQRKEPAVTLDDVAAFLKEKKKAFKEVHIVVTGDTHGGALTQLRKRLDELMSDRRYSFMVRTEDERKKKASGE